MANTPTPHIGAQKGDFAKTVLLPGDPLRAEFIAKNYLSDVKQVTNVRNMLGFTGTWEGKKVSVMGGGMGIPSCCIYSHELFNFYDVDNIIRIGSAGSMSEKCPVRSVVLAQGACTTSSWQGQYTLRGNIAPIADWHLLYSAYTKALDKGLAVEVGNIVSADAFYDADATINDVWKKMGCLCVEMEAAGLYMEAAASKKRALAILTISDSLITGEALPAEERQKSFHEMMELALSVAE